MPSYALYQNNEIINIILAENKEMAEQASGLNAIQINKYPGIGWILVDGNWNPPNTEQWAGWSQIGDTWAPPKPYSGWIWDGDFWQPPVPMPENGNYIWDNSSESWINVDEIKESEYE